MQSRLDRLYITSNITPTLMLTTTNPLSDHDVVSLRLEIPISPPRGRGLWKNNVETYDDADFQKELEIKFSRWHTNTQSLNPTNRWLSIKKSLTGLIRRYSRIIAGRKTLDNDNLQQQLDHTRNLLATHPTPALHALFEQTKTQLVKKLIAHNKQLILKSKIHSLENNQSDKQVYKEFMQHRKQSTITELSDEYGLPRDSPQELLQITHEFYQDLYASQPVNEQIQADFLLDTLNPLSAEESEKIALSPTGEEIAKVVGGLKNGKSPGPDGLSSEFYKKFWPIISSTFTSFVIHTFDSHNIPSNMKLGIITLIHKKNNTDDIKNYRPISLLNTDLKIISKLLNERIKSTLQNIITPTQFAQPGKSTTDASILLRDLLWDATRKKKTQKHRYEQKAGEK